ncbi:MAG: hypothetical protein ACXVWW_02330 [Nocardioides sp.]
MIQILIGFVLVLLLLVVQTVVWAFQLVVALIRLPYTLLASTHRARSARTLTA